MNRIIFVVVGTAMLLLLLSAANTQAIKADFPTFVPSRADGVEEHVHENDESTLLEMVKQVVKKKASEGRAHNSSGWSVIEASATQEERGVTFALVLEGQGEVMVDLQLIRSGNLIINERLSKHFKSVGRHTVTHKIRIPHRLGDLSVTWQLMDKKGKTLTSMESIAIK
ncbi:MAG: hypothetical protein ACPGWR_17395 [Ardenticatenaceae bacterium]